MYNVAYVAGSKIKIFFFLHKHYLREVSLTNLLPVMAQTQYICVKLVGSVSLSKYKHGVGTCGNIMVPPYATE